MTSQKSSPKLKFKPGDMVERLLTKGANIVLEAELKDGQEHYRLAHYDLQGNLCCYPRFESSLGLREVKHDSVAIIDSVKLNRIRHKHDEWS